VHGNWLGLLELLIVFGFALGWGVLELVALRLDKKRETRESTPPTDDETKP
jgi:hypothetical protein